MRFRWMLAAGCGAVVLSAQSAPSAESATCQSVAQRNASPAVRASVEQTARTRTGAGALFLRGCLLLGAGESAKAADAFAQATTLAPTTAHYFDWLGRAYGDQARSAGTLTQALLARKTKAAFERAVQLDPNSIDARSFLVQYHMIAPAVMGGSEKEAMAQLAAIQARNPYRGTLLGATIKARRNDMPGAVADLTALSRSHPDSLAPRTTLFNTLLRARRFADAAQVIETTRAAFPRSGWPDSAASRLAAARTK